MRLGSYNVREYGGKHSGEYSTHYTNNELVLERDDIAYVIHALRRGNAKDKEFAKRMFDLLMPHERCESCSKRICTAGHEANSMYGKTLCFKCWSIMTDIDFLLKKTMDLDTKEKRLSILASIQKGRESWCPKGVNYLVNERTYDKCVKKYIELFGKE